MSISKSTLISTLTKFKELQDSYNDGKFVEQEAGKGLSTNDFSNADQSKLAGVADGAQVNVIESISIDGTAQSISGKGVSLDLSAYAKKTDISAALIFKGSKASFSQLPTTGNTVGDVWNIQAAGGTDSNGTAIKAGDNVAFTSEGWDVLAGTTDLSNYYTKTEIAQQFTNADETISDTEINALFNAS